MLDEAELERQHPGLHRDPLLERLDNDLLQEGIGDLLKECGHGAAPGLRAGDHPVERTAEALADAVPQRGHFIDDQLGARQFIAPGLYADHRIRADGLRGLLHRRQQALHLGGRLLLQRHDLRSRLRLGQQPSLLLGLDRFLRIAHPLGDLPPLRFQRRKVGLRRLHVDESVDQRDALRVVLGQQSRLEVTVAAFDGGLPVGIRGRAGDLRQFFTCLRQCISQFTFGLRRLAGIGLLNVGAPVVERDQIGFHLGHLGLGAQAVVLRLAGGGDLLTAGQFALLARDLGINLALLDGRFLRVVAAR